MELNKNKQFGIYIHIPFCLQRCYYCDFATYTHSEVSTTIDEYLEALFDELQKGAQYAPQKELSTIYFGGGTPSLLSTAQFSRVLNKISQVGFHWSGATEITIEINPATLDKEKILELQRLGVNRYSVGAQTFDEQILKKLNRKHSARDTHQTLELLSNMGCNYSFDLLFALPGQDMKKLEFDLAQIEHYRPPHVSPYYLTIPQHHFLNTHRPSEEIELGMFSQMRSRLEGMGYHQYEISNFAQKEKESRHNLLYWTDQSYWGVGLSSHSYFAEAEPWGLRFFNPKSLPEYLGWAKSWMPAHQIVDGRLKSSYEKLQPHEALTDLCHTSLRLSRGLEIPKVIKKFGSQVIPYLNPRLEGLIGRGWLEADNEDGFRLTGKGKDLSNQVFLELTFTAEDYPAP